MSGVYVLMDTLLPFEWLHYTFMKNALIAIVLLTPLFGMLGTMAVDNKMAFFSDALGHSALTGIAIGVVLGWQSQMSAMLLFGLIWAVLITFVKHHSKMSADLDCAGACRAFARRRVCQIFLRAGGRRALRGAGRFAGVAAGAGGHNRLLGFPV